MNPNRTGDALRRLINLVSHRSGSVLAVMDQAAITLPQILLLSRIERLGTASLSDLAEHSFASTAALSQMIERLVQQDWVSRAEDRVDRRRKAIQLTPKGRRLLRRMEAARSSDYEIGLAPLSQELRAQLAAVAEKAAAEIESSFHGGTQTPLLRARQARR
ncbi:MAG TPA: MarR family transcriptional regulator [Roseiarcus sp.]|nr:MarR family transcriptional regulator [Roseiarcus sp.]